MAESKNLLEKLSQNKLPPELSELLGHYDEHLIARAKTGHLGETEYLCYMRFIDDLSKIESRSYQFYFDDTEVKRVMEFASLLTVYDDKGNKSPLRLLPPQKFVIANLFGWRFKRNGFLRFRESFIEIARRNGKSWLDSVLLHYFATASHFRSKRCICFSVKKDSAMIVFKQFVSFIEADDDLDELYDYSDSVGKATSKVTNNYIEVFSGAIDQDGFESVYATADEIALMDGKLYRLIADGQANLPESQLVGITTAGFMLEGWCHKRYKAIKKALKAGTLRSTLFVFITEPDDEDDLSDIDNVAKANPILFFDEKGRIKKDVVNVYRGMCRDAFAHGGQELNSWITKQCNRWNQKADAMLCDMGELEKCKYKFPFQDVLDKYKTWYLGVDLAQVADLNSICFATWIKVSPEGLLLDADAVGGKEVLYLHHYNYMPSETLTRHIELDHVPYNLYLDKELFLTYGGGGLRTDYKEIYEHIKKLKDDNELSFKVIACDAYGTSTIQSELEGITDQLIIQSQHRKALTPYIQTFGVMVASHEIAISEEDSEIFLKAIANSVVIEANDGFLEVHKMAQGDGDSHRNNVRIDAVDACLNAIIAPIIDHNKEADYTTDQAIDDMAELYGL